MKHSTLLLGLTAVAALTVASMAVSGAFAAGDQANAGAAEDFEQYCAACHGRDAKGDGPVAPLLIRHPPDLTRLAARNDGVFPEDRVQYIIDGRGDVLAHGPREMPVWGFEFGASMNEPLRGPAKARIQALSRYLRSLQQ